MSILFLLSLAFLKVVFADQDLNCLSGFFYQQDLDICLNASIIPATWADALSVCQSAGGDLLSIHNAFQNNLLAKLQYNLTGAARGYLGAHESQGQYRWSDDTPFDYQRFQPSGEGNCVTLDSRDQGWRAAHCSDLLNYLCAAPKIGDFTVPTVPTPSTNLSCLDPSVQSISICKQGWQYSLETGYQYLVLQEKAMHEGEVYCQSLAAQLVSIHSKAENDFVTNLCCETDCHTSNSDHWTAVYLTGGLRQVNGTTTWTDGTPYDYKGNICSAFPINEPNHILVGFGQLNHPSIRLADMKFPFNCARIVCIIIITLSPISICFLNL